MPRAGCDEDQRQAGGQQGKSSKPGRHTEVEDQQQGENDAQSHLGGTGRALADHRRPVARGRRKQREVDEWLRFTALDHHEDDRCNDSDDQDASHRE